MARFNVMTAWIVPRRQNVLGTAAESASRRGRGRSQINRRGHALGDNHERHNHPEHDQQTDEMSHGKLPS
jgi:hypothetical protein